MTHKVHPKAFRIKELSDWKTRGYYKKPAESLEEDFVIREFLQERIGKFGVEKIEIERFPNKLSVIIFSSRPGLIIGRGGEEIEKLKKDLEKRILKKIKTPSIKVSTAKKKKAKKEEKKTENEIKLEIREIRDYWASAELSAQWVAQQLEKRVAFRRVLKQGLGKIMSSKAVKGARVEVAGRLNGAEMARREWIMEGELPRSSIRADIDYAQVNAVCSYGTIGVKVWIYKGEKFD
jgi:small subunit ribosomal protein S3